LFSFPSSSWGTQFLAQAPAWAPYRKITAMLNCNKLGIYLFALIALIHFAPPAFSQDKPSPYAIRIIVTRLIMYQPSPIKTRGISDIKITKEFFSPDNGRYCLEVTYFRIATDGKIYPEKGKFFIVKKANIWVGGQDGWPSDK
jgi:hypothetical protein